jgi:membrane protein implicated in regulation of membrane protease activity
LSLRFWTYALTAFGLSGALCRLLSVPFVLELPAAIALGLGVGLGAAWAIHTLKVSTVTTDQNLKTLVGGEATVVLPVSAGQVGKVRMRLGDQDVELTATTREDTPIPRGATAFVIAMNGERVEVASMRSLDPLSAKARARVAPPQAR